MTQIKILKMEKDSEHLMQDLVNITKGFESKKTDLMINNAKLTYLNKVLQRSFESGMSLTLLRDYIIKLIDES